MLTIVYVRAQRPSGWCQDAHWCSSGAPVILVLHWSSSALDPTVLRSLCAPSPPQQVDNPVSKPRSLARWPTSSSPSRCSRICSRLGWRNWNEEKQRNVEGRQIQREDGRSVNGAQQNKKNLILNLFWVVTIKIVEYWKELERLIQFA